MFPAARKLNALDESKVIGALGGIEEAPRELTAFELVSELEPRDMHGRDRAELASVARSSDRAAARPAPQRAERRLTSHCGE